MDPFVDTMISISADVLLVAVVITMPVGIVCLIAETSFGLMNRVAPQINVFFLSMPVKMMLGIVIVFFILGFLAQQMRLHIVQMLRDVDTVIQLF